MRFFERVGGSPGCRPQARPGNEEEEALHEEEAPDGERRRRRGRTGEKTREHEPSAEQRDLRCNGACRCAAVEKPAASDGENRAATNGELGGRVSRNRGTG